MGIGGGRWCWLRKHEARKLGVEKAIGGKGPSGRAGGEACLGVQKPSLEPVLELNRNSSLLEVMEV